ncbi:hypothetical protein SAMN05192553_10586 [Cyclobacterium xiamenense]|uniref:Uncharacterized protein n=1 Tax=Cyclobacterium xiamenense TaxID=1297121 RepID=A0A1H7A4S0_9BACT|nr:hypothetical protein [Cyclobacterium xiamenense]SEJ56045.1 hypothetical protein SAMN05192553_10586 [Cyclobacterium xiamenense]
MSWAAGFTLAVEINQTVINLVLDKFLQHLLAQLTYQAKLGRIGSFEATVKDLELLDLEDPAPLGGVASDLQAQADFKMKLFGIQIVNTTMTFTINDVELDLSRTAAGLPKGVVIKITPTLSVKISFSGGNFMVKWLLNGIVAPLVSFGIWMAFKLIRKVEIPVWDLIDIFGILGLSFAPNSPLLTAQRTVLPTSLLLASDFNLTAPSMGVGQQLKHFNPPNTSIGAVVNDKVISAAVQIAISKGWVPSQFRVASWKIYLNSIHVGFEQDKVVATGSLKAKRGKCWCRVKAKISFRAAVSPEIKGAPTQPKLDFIYDANINTQISTSGMLVVLGVILFAPVFMSLTISMSFLINIVLNHFLPFTTSWQQNGLQLSVTANSVNYTGFTPLSMQFPLQLSGSGSYDLTNFRQFTLPGNGPQMQVEYTNESIAIQPNELRLAIDLQ